MLLSASPELDVLLPLQAYVQPGPSSVSSCSFCVWKNLNTSYLYNAAILASFFFIRVFKGVLSSEFVD